MKDNDLKNMDRAIETDPLLRTLGVLEEPRTADDGCPSIGQLEVVTHGRGGRETLEHLNRCAFCRSCLVALATDGETETEVPRARLEAILEAARPRADVHRSAWWGWLEGLWTVRSVRPLAAVLGVAAVLAGLPWVLLRESSPGGIALEPFLRGAISLEPGLYRAQDARDRIEPPPLIRLDPSRKVLLRWFPIEAPGAGALPSVAVGSVSESNGSVVALEATVRRVGDTLEIEVLADQQWFGASADPRRVVLLIGPSGEALPSLSAVVETASSELSSAGGGGPLCSKTGHDGWWVCWTRERVAPEPGHGD